MRIIYSLPVNETLIAGKSFTSAFSYLFHQLQHTAGALQWLRTKENTWLGYICMWQSAFYLKEWLRGCLQKPAMCCPESMYSKCMYYNKVESIGGISGAQNDQYLTICFSALALHICLSSMTMPHHFSCHGSDLLIFCCPGAKNKTNGEELCWSLWLFIIYTVYILYCIYCGVIPNIRVYQSQFETLSY